ncbi:carbohydrate-binding module family 1 protein [Aaosphaeria arxii CBS 175.79]|uniref:AA9 family lytic polysaccharide monooxygenase n=1 Tax=Aaosphaeria arxii CBS 175.79 TaxID=1450172 RepID=A0A6A5XSN2_9PLEO|nr:carbohydrate-binding module family 1 protein [Aaosphaeria arxii CBS 175.79]KAF2015817.1 carbohydrate-binding module family 1 protein [Aaosphaeria arxii CBS 175.79]
MKVIVGLAGIVTLAPRVLGHATWQQLWVNVNLTIQYGGVCARLPNNNNPITDVTSNDIRCNANQGFASSKCSVAAGGTVTIEMHQHNTRGCTEEAIGGAHYGPVLVYLSKVADASTADGSTPFFKIFQDTWARASSTSQGSDDYWGTKDLNKACGKMDVLIPANLAPGDYLLRAEAIALHSASSSGGAQFYMTCYQITVTGGGSSNPSGVSFPGAYKASDPGILFNMYQVLSTPYVAPGPAVIPGGTEAVAGKAGSSVTASGGASQPTATQIAVSSSFVTSARPATTTSPGTGGCTPAKQWDQCGGNGFTGCGCVAGSTCKKLNDFYSQCQ